MNARDLQGVNHRFKLLVGVKPQDVPSADYDHFADNLAWTEHSLKVASKVDADLLQLVLSKLTARPLQELAFANEAEVAALMEVDAMLQFSLSRAVEHAKYVHVGAMRGFDEYMLARCGDCSAAFTVSWPLFDPQTLGKLALAHNVTPLLNQCGTTTARTKMARDSIVRQVGSKAPLCLVSHEPNSGDNDFPQWPNEIVEFPGLAGRVALALECLAAFGTLVVVVGQVAAPCSVELMLVLSQCFERLKIVKPLSSILIDTARLVVCQSFQPLRYLNSDAERLLHARAQSQPVDCFAPMCDFTEVVHSQELHAFREFVLASSAWAAELLDAMTSWIAASFDDRVSVDDIRKRMTEIMQERAQIDSWSDSLTWFLEPKRFVYYRPSPWTLNANLAEHAKSCFINVSKFARGPTVFLLIVCIPVHARDERTVLRVQNRKVEVLHRDVAENARLFAVAAKLVPGYALLLSGTDHFKLEKIVSSPREPRLFESEPTCITTEFVERALK